MKWRSVNFDTVPLTLLNNFLKLELNRKNSSPAVVENKLIVRRCLEYPCNMLTMAVPEVESLAVCLFTV